MDREPPAWLRNDDARAKYKELAATLALTVRDADLLACYCDAFGDFLAAYRIIEQDGPDPRGKPHPMFRVKYNGRVGEEQR